MNMADPWAVLLNSLTDSPENHFVCNRDMQAMQQKATMASAARRAEQRAERKQKVIGFLVNHGDALVEDIVGLLGYTRDTITKLLTQMEHEKTIRRYYKEVAGFKRARKFVKAL